MFKVKLVSGYESHDDYIQTRTHEITVRGSMNFGEAERAAIDEIMPLVDDMRGWVRVVSIESLAV